MRLGELKYQRYGSENDRNLQKLKKVAVYSSLGVGVLLISRYFYKKYQTNQAERHALDEGDPATFAQQLKMAFENNNWLGWGTNYDQVKQVFNEIPSKSAYSKVQTAYSHLFSKSLNADLQDELSSDEYNEIIRILNAKRK